MTENDVYEPTPAEKRLLDVLLDVENVGKTVKELCNLAEISRNKYYESMKKEEFVELVNGISMSLIKGKASAVLNATFKYALEEKGHQDRKMILTMAGLYTDKQQTEISGQLKMDKLGSILSQLGDEDE
ncbi:MAG: hypothetical protein H9W82_13310 [Lactobacillus sp.]|nr:hypothetical protein [Lactobacillus sp.]